MRFLRYVLSTSLLVGLCVCLGCSDTSTQKMRNFKEGTGPDMKYGEIKSKDGKVVKKFEDEPPEPQAPPLQKK
jgi:hypothetical protein